MWWKGFVTVYDVGDAKTVPASEEIPFDPVFPLTHYFAQDPATEEWCLVLPHTREIVVAYYFGLFWKSIETSEFNKDYDK